MSLLELCNRCYQTNFSNSTIEHLIELKQFRDVLESDNCQDPIYEHSDEIAEKFPFILNFFISFGYIIL